MANFHFKMFLWPLLAAWAMLASCTDNTGWHTASGVIWGTTYTVTRQGDSDGDALIQQALARVDHVFNAFDSTSVTGRLNRGLTPGDTTGLDMMGQVLTKARRVHNATGGAFDPTVGPLTDWWGFGAGSAAQDPRAVPDSVRALVGLNRIPVIEKNTRLPQGMRLDFAAIAKGYAVDCVAAAIPGNNVLVEIGGEVSARGTNKNRLPWRVQIDAPVPGDASHTRLLAVNLNNCCVATSGNYRNYRDLADGTRVGHTINPATGQPAATAMLSATVFARDCVTADALATALMVMDHDTALQLIRGLGWNDVYGAILVWSGADGAPVTRKVNIDPRHVTF